MKLKHHLFIFLNRQISDINSGVEITRLQHPGHRCLTSVDARQCNLVDLLAETAGFSALCSSVAVCSETYFSS